MYTDFDQQAFDIDWYLTNGKEVAFMTSAGTCLPRSVAESAQNNMVLQEYFEGLPYTTKFVINPDLENIINSEADEQYLSSFINMAMKGLYAFDKTNLGLFNDPNCHLVATPVTPLNVNLLPTEIASIIMKTRLNGPMGLTFNISILK
ncbi:hypothetical protein FHW88_002923 [Mucilaginibacter sp. SG538B]|uniref:hypothetical protein n=1 Tax=Mucilaginibacter sp. SG538B TaxID=2587021 RepID=UPI00159DF531|nr:hypothetical protein [Mucilaginibacter sp. SG538B]NVM64634.1 hypothetical protein [Mucilaginibacter sp. SG538B]